MTEIFKQPADIVTIPAPSGGVTIGAGVLVDKLLGVALDTKAEGVLVDLQRTGVVSVSKVSAQAWAIGDRIYWDASAAKFTTVATPVVAGIAHKDAANPSAKGEVILTPGTQMAEHVIHVNLPTNGEAVDAAFFIADRAYRVTSVREVHAVAGNDAGAVTIDVKKQTGTQTPAQGVSVLAVAFDGKGTANTVVTKAGADLTATAADLLLAAGNRLSLDLTGTTTNLAGVVVVVTLEVL